MSMGNGQRADTSWNWGIEEDERSCMALGSTSTDQHAAVLFEGGEAFLVMRE